MEHKNFWHEVFLANTSVTPGIKWRIGIFGFIATIIWAVGTSTSLIPTSDIAPYELIGAALAVLLMLRTNTGYDRWYEGRKLWGGIVNQSRNLAQIGLAYGPEDPKWRDKFVRWTAAFSHSCRHSLRGQTSLEDMRVLLGDEETDALAAAQHKPMYVAQRLAKMLRQAVDDGQMDRFAFMEAEQQRCLLIDHIGACERIMKTPLAKALSVKIRRFLFLYLCALPFGIFDRADFMTPLIVMLVAYPLLALDQISVELQNPFSQSRVSHLPLDDICRTIQTNVLAMLDEETDVETVDEDTAPIRRAKLAV
jgi:putative membrane protein